MGKHHPIAWPRASCPRRRRCSSSTRRRRPGSTTAACGSSPINGPMRRRGRSPARLRDSGVELLDVEVVWIKPGPANADHLRIVDIGAELGARNVLCVSSDPDPGAAEDKLNQIIEHGSKRGIRINLEFGLFTGGQDHPSRAHAAREDGRTLGGPARRQPSLAPLGRHARGHRSDSSALAELCAAVRCAAGGGGPRRCGGDSERSDRWTDVAGRRRPAARATSSIGCRTGCPSRSRSAQRRCAMRTPISMSEPARWRVPVGHFSAAARDAASTH